MGRPLRFVPQGALVEVMNRTVQGRWLLKPVGPLAEIILGILGRAQRLFDMDVVAFIFLSNHYHMLLRPKDPKQLADFMGYVGSNIAREAARLLDWEGPVWAGRYHSMVVSDEESAQVARLKYLMSNGCKEGLVARPRDWTGATTTAALLSGQTTLAGVWYDRSQECRARHAGRLEVFPQQETLSLSSLPCWIYLDKQETQIRLSDLVRQIEEETARMHKEQGTSPKCMDRVLRAHPHDRPPTLERSPTPLFYAATRKALWALHEAYRMFVTSYRHAAERLKAGDLHVEFPFGSFPPPPPFVQAVAPG